MATSNFQAEAKILRGPHEFLESYLEACDQLRSVIKFFSSNKNFKGGVSVITHATTLLTKSTGKLEEEFRQLLTSYRFADFSCCCSQIHRFFGILRE